MNWSTSPLKNLLEQEIKNGYSPVCGTEVTGKWILGLGAVGPDGLNPNEVKPAPLNDKKVDSFKLRSGDFLVSRSNTRSRVGFSAVFRGEVDNCSYPDLLMRFRVDETKILEEYLERYLYSDSALSYLQGSASGTNQSMVKITKGILEALPVRLPPLPIQSKIVELMRVWSKGIYLSSSLTSKLEARKIGLFQTFLKKQDYNLLDFKLSELADIRKGTQLSKKDMVPSGTYYALNGGILPSGFTNEWNTSPDTISISEGGNSCGYVNYNLEKFWSGGHCYTIHPIGEQIDNKFLFQILKFNESKIMGLRVGSGLPNIQKSALSDFTISIPENISIQQKIAEQLFLADTEISLLKSYTLKLKTMRKVLFDFAVNSDSLAKGAI